MMPLRVGHCVHGLGLGGAQQVTACWWRAADGGGFDM